MESCGINITIVIIVIYLCLFLTGQRNDQRLPQLHLTMMASRERPPQVLPFKQPVGQLSVGAARRRTVNAVSPVVLVSISVCCGDDKETGDDVKGSVGQPGKSNAF